MAEISKRPRPSQQAGDLPASHLALIDPLYGPSGASRWHLDRESFRAALSKCLCKVLPPVAADAATVQRVLTSLHLEDLVLACACIEGSEAAWEHFVATYRPYLRSAAAIILRRPSGSPEAIDLADSLFAELYGMADGKPGQGSLFCYFHGRSSLKTWLRAVLAQRHIDRIRASRRFTDLEDGEVSGRLESFAPVRAPSVDPHRDRYLRMFHRALQDALASLDARDTQRLSLYYRDEKTLAEIGRLLGEHESSVSRNLDRVRSSLRAAVEASLRAGFAVANGSPPEPGLNDAEMAVCLEYAAEDSGLNLETLLSPGSPQSPGQSATKGPAFEGKRP